MRKAILLAALTAGAAIALVATPSAAAPRLANPSDAETFVTRIADVDRTAARREGSKGNRAGSSGHWHYRLEASRWLHDQHVNAGYPASRFGGSYCCGHHRHWPWMGRYHHGSRYWIWMGHRHHHHHHHW